MRHCSHEFNFYKRRKWAKKQLRRWIEKCSSIVRKMQACNTKFYALCCTAVALQLSSASLEDDALWNAAPLLHCIHEILWLSVVSDALHCAFNLTFRVVEAKNATAEKYVELPQVMLNQSHQSVVRQYCILAGDRIYFMASCKKIRRNYMGNRVQQFSSALQIIDILENRLAAELLFGSGLKNNFNIFLRNVEFLNSLA